LVVVPSKQIDFNKQVSGTQRRNNEDFHPLTPVITDNDSVAIISSTWFVLLHFAKALWL
jgi:hypothetical protein